MIWEFIINSIAFALRVVTTPITLLNDVTLPSEITNGIAIISPYYSSLNPILPIDTILFLITVVEIPFLVGLGVYFVIRWIYQKLPFLN